MEEEAARFGAAVGLDSVSTFECIIEDDHHYFMEMNTRVQVEHRVTELCYALRFSKPDDTADSFVVNSIVELMVLLAAHGPRLPEPVRESRESSSVEVRLNATDQALKPHAGGIVRSWTVPVEKEQRDDQGIGITNPDTGMLQPYNLAGAYDSNIALSITSGDSRRESFENLSEILRCMKFRGLDLHLNVDFQYGLLHWMLGNDPMLKPNTSFVSSYLALVGKLKRLCDQINLDLAWNIHGEKIKSDFGPEGLKIFEQKLTLILRPLKILFERPHLLMGWLALLKAKTGESRDSNKLNPVKILINLYNYLRLEKLSDVPPSEQIWSNDQILLDSATSFYKDLESQLSKKFKGWAKLKKFLTEQKASIPPNFVKNKELWEMIISAHNGHQMSLELLQLPEIIGEEAGYYGLKVNNSLEVEVPEMLNEPGIFDELIAELDPAPPTRKNEILAWTGGTSILVKLLTQKNM